MTAVAVMLAVGGLLSGRAGAATGSIYLSPSTASVKNGSSVTLSTYINPGSTPVYAASVKLTYDTSKLSYQSVSTSGTAFPQSTSTGHSGNAVTFSGLPNSGVSSTSFIFSVTFTALASSGSSAVQVDSSSAAADGDSNIVTESLSGATVSFTAATTSGGGTTTTTPPATTTTTTTTSPKTTTPTTTKTTPTASTGTPAPTQTTTPATTSGATTTTTTPTSNDTISKLHIGAYYRNNKPIVNAKITLHSTPQTVETDDKGVATFTDVPIGDHTVIFEQDGKTYSRPLTLTSVQANDTASVVSIVFDAAPPSGPSPAVFIIPLLLIVVAVLGYTIWRRRQDSGAFYPSASFAPATVMPATPSQPQTEHNDAMDSLLTAAPTSTPTVPGATVSPSDATSSSEPAGIPLPSLATNVAPAPAAPAPAAPAPTIVAPAAPAPAAPLSGTSNTGKLGL